ncbi:serine protease [Brevundimonas sp.]|uniref:S1 family peptidase n=1 Tax=Brevundimonas sp. TaxID=1871086 RepID=UPI00351D812B
MEWSGRRWLVTNRHVVTGRDQTSGQPLSSHGGVPDRVRIRTAPKEGWIEQILIDEDGKTHWFEHPTLGSEADIVCFEVPPSVGVPEHLSPRHILADRADPISVVGYPMGATGVGDAAVWATGFLASAIDDAEGYDSKPVFLIDCRTREGQSGSPVYLFRRGMLSTLSGDIHADPGRSWSELVGIYSGRIRNGTDIGMVWKAKAVEELLVAADLKTQTYTSLPDNFLRMSLSAPSAGGGRS